MQKKYSRRWTALVLTVLMLLTMLPTAPASAEDPYWCCPVCGSYDGFDPGRYIPPTCTQSGALSGYCGNCYDNNPDDETYGYVEGLVPALGHDWGDWEFGNMYPTCTEGAPEYRYCSRCKEMETRMSDPLGHDWGEWNVTKNPTCTEDGYREHVCNRCGYKEGESIPARGHAYGDWTVTKQPTCTEEGEQQSKCSRCGKTLTEKITALGHIYGEWVTDSQPTCVKEGQKHTTCSRCGDTVYDSIPTTDHKWGSWHVIQEPTEFACGYEQRECQVCGTPQKRPIYPDGAIRNGDRGDDVKKLQEKLNEEGKDCGKADGIAGSKTEEGIRQWQEEHGYTPDGVWYPGYWDVPGDVPGPTDPPITSAPDIPPVTEPPVQPDDPTKDVYSEVYLEIASIDKNAMFYGESAEVVLKATNTGSTILTVWGYQDNNENGTFPAADEFHEQPGWDYLMPGESFLTVMVVQSDIEDRDFGYVYRKVNEVANAWLHEDTMTPVLPNDDIFGNQVATTEDSSTWIKSNVVEFRIELLNEGEELPVLDLASTYDSHIRYGLNDDIYIKNDLANIGADHLHDLSVSYEISNDNNGMDSGRWWVTSPDVAPGDVVGAPFKTTVSAADVARGYIDVAFTGHGWTMDNTTEVHTGTVKLRIPVYDVGPRPPVDPDPEPIPDTYKLVLAIDEISPLTSEYYNGNKVTLRWTVMNLSNVDVSFGGIVRYPDPSDAGYGSGSMQSFVGQDPSVILTANGGDVSGETDIYLNKAEAIDDVIHSIFEAYGCEAGTGVNVCVSNRVELTHKLSDGTPPWEIPATTSVEVKKAFATAPKNVNGFMEGEEITYEITVTNTCTETITDIDVNDLLKGSNEDALVGTILSLDPGCSETVSFVYKVTFEDIVNGYIKNTAEASWIDADSGSCVTEKSNQVIVPTTNEINETADLSLIKTVAGDPPKNGRFFVEGETVTFGLTVTNNTPYPFDNVIISDILVSGSDKTIKTIPILDPNASEYFEYTYVVTGLDAQMGFVTNTAAAVGTDYEGYKHLAISNDVSVNTGVEKTTEEDGTSIETGSKDPFGVITDLEITKTEISKPANGAFYQKGEVIRYTITLKNVGESTMDEVLIYDTLKEPIGSEMASIELFYPGSVRSYTFEYTVTDEDVANGYVVNYATAIYYMGSYTDFRIAGPVISDTDGNPDTFTGEEKKFDKEIKLGGDEGEYVPCMRILDAKGNAETDYTLHTCTIHQPAEEKVAALVSAAKTDAEKAEAWKQAQAIWTEEIDKIYDACFEAAANVTSLTAIINDKAMFYAQLNVWKASLELIYADQPAVVEEKVAEALMNRCHDFCCEVHTAPEARADSLLHEHALLADAEPAAVCERTILAKEGSDVRYAEKLCGEHAAIMQMIDQLLADSGNKYEGVWDSAVNIWIGELNNDTNERYREADADERSIIAADRMTFDSWLKAHDAIIAMFYPEDYSTRVEVYYKTIMNRVVDYCTAK